MTREHIVGGMNLVHESRSVQKQHYTGLAGIVQKRSTFLLKVQSDLHMAFFFFFMHFFCPCNLHSGATYTQKKYGTFMPAMKLGLNLNSSPAPTASPYPSNFRGIWRGRAVQNMFFKGRPCRALLLRRSAFLYVGGL